MTLLRKPRQLVLSGLLLLGLLVLPSSPAAGHSALQSADPVPGSTTDQPVQTLTLVFAQPVDVLPDSVQVNGPEGGLLEIGESTRAADGVTVTATLTNPLPGGTSIVAWRVIGGDGHPIQGTYPLISTNASAAPGPPTQPAPGAADPVSAGAESSGVPWIAVVFVLALVGAIVIRLRANEAATSHDPEAPRQSGPKREPVKKGSS